MKLRYIENRVIELMNTFPATKDDDNLLLAHYLKTFKTNEKSSEVEVADFIVLEKVATTFKTIERVRRKVQNKYPNLRGKAWAKRHKAQEDFIEYAIE